MNSKTQNGTAEMLGNGGRVPRPDQKRTCLERVLILALAGTLLVVIILAILLSVALKPEESDLCLTKECTSIAARVNSFIDYHVNPCDDFYDFACGSWMKKASIPDDAPGVYVYGELNNDIKRVVKNLLESTIDDDVDAVRKAKDYYRACMNESQIEHLNASELLLFIEVLGGWPTLGDQKGGRWNESTFDLVANLVALREFKISPFLEVRVGEDSKKSSKRIIQIGAPAFSLSSKNYYFDDSFAELRQAYAEFAKNVAVLLGADPVVAQTDVTELLELEAKLSNYTLSNTEMRNETLTYNKMTVAKLEANYGPAENNRHGFNWTTYLQMVMEIAEENVTVGPSEEIILASTRYFRHLFEILEDTSPRTLRNYLSKYAVTSLINYLPKRFVDEIAKYMQVSRGVTNVQNRWKICTAVTSEVFGMAVGRLFVRENFDEEAKEKALEMIHGIRGEFEGRVRSVSWMDESTKRVAVDKAKNIREQIGYPDSILNVTTLNDQYSEVSEIKPDAYFSNALKIHRIYAKNSLQNLRKSSKKDYDTWHISPTTVNAFYQPGFNLICFPAAILQPPFYSKYQPRSMNYGGIGWLIGHEITHAFGDSGRKYDKHGNMVKWWSDEATANFNSRTKCFKSQYSAFVSPVAGIPINGEQTLGENIVDNAGLQYSYKAYKKWQVKSKQKEARLPGLNFDHDQLFFINFAQGWCGMSTEKGETHQINTDVHSPWRFRITGSLQNSAEFAKAFQCPVGSHMNPRIRCQLW